MAYTWSAAIFRETLPEFADTGLYPNAILNNWAAIAQIQIRARAWGGSDSAVYALAINLFVAHEATIEARDMMTANAGGVPGGAAGLINTKTVGSATIGYDTQSISEKDAGWWNQTSYGRQLFRLINMYGAGATQL